MIKKLLRKVIDKVRPWVKYSCGQLTHRMPEIYDRMTTSQLIANDDNLSLVRYGDGELSQILTDYNVGFQTYNAELSKRLLQILISKDDPKVLVCLPNLFSGLSNLKKEPKQYWMGWINNNREALSKILVYKKYGDSLVSRLYLPWNDISNEMDIVGNIKKSWEKKNVVVIEGAKTRWGVGNDLLENTLSVKRILCPSQDAFSKYEAILTNCLQIGTKSDVFVLALGPTATVLAYDLAQRGYRALDLGHFDLQYEHLVRHAKERMQINGKYNNELTESFQSGEDDQKYQKEIVINLSGE